MSTKWTELFADFEQRLNEWLARAEEPTPIQPPQMEPAALSQFGQRLERLQAYLDKAEHEAERAFVPLSSDIHELQQWLDKLSTARTKLT